MVRWTDRLAMTIAVGLDVKQQNKHAKSPYCKSSTRHEIEVRKYTDPAEVNITLRVDKSICLPKLKSLTVFGFLLPSIIGKSILFESFCCHRNH